MNSNGATPEDEANFKRIISQEPENKKCFECGYPNPQWCDYSHGVFVCLDCSGVHRGLGAHLCQVRSATMDGWSNWNPTKFRQMELGGNRNAREYFDANGIPKTPIRARYEHAEAQKYRCILEAKAEGRTFDPTTFKPFQAQQQQQQRGGGNNADRFKGQGSSGGGSSSGGGGGGDDWMTVLNSGLSSVAVATSSAIGTVSTGASRLAEKTQQSVKSTTEELSSAEFSSKVKNTATDSVDAVGKGVKKAWGAVAFFATSIASGAGAQDDEDDGLSGLTRNVERAPQGEGTAENERFRGMGHQREPSTPSSPGGLGGLTRNLPHEQQCQYEGIGGGAGGGGHHRQFSTESGDGLNAMTRNLPHEQKCQYGGMGHQREYSTESGDGLTAMTRNLPHEQKCQYESVGGNYSTPLQARRTFTPTSGGDASTGKKQFHSTGTPTANSSDSPNGSNKKAEPKSDEWAWDE